jgi:two-component system response regulator DesR
MPRNRRAAQSCGMASATPTTAPKTPTVFLADDSGPLRARIAGLLRASARVVGEGETPRQCIDGILATRPDVVVLDVQLEGGQGIEVLRAVRASNPHVAFVVFSNNSNPAYRKRYLGAGAARFLDKSTEFDQLAAAVTAAHSTISH